MDKEIKKKAVEKIGCWINAEFLAAESLDTKKSEKGSRMLKIINDRSGLPSSFYSEVKKISENSKETPFYVQFVFGNINRKMFAEYLCEKYGCKEIAKVPFDKDERMALFHVVCSCSLPSSVKGRGNAIKLDSVELAGISTLCIAEHILRSGNDIKSLDSKKYEEYKKRLIESKEWKSLTSGKHSVEEVFAGGFKCFENWLWGLGENAEKIEDKETRKAYYRVAGSSDNPDFNSCTGLGIDSFYIKDLELIKDKIEKGLFGDSPYEKKILDYVIEDGSAKPADCINISKDADDKGKLRKLFEDSLTVLNCPMGKWPGGNNPYLMQQLAVNLFRQNENCVFSVNGPPGTGKSTLLKEVIADVLTRKVSRIVSILEEINYKPDDIFDRGGKVLKEKYRDLYDYSIIVASGNNQAVENITQELPSRLYSVPAYCSIMSDNNCRQYTKLPIMATLGKKGNLEKYNKNKYIKKQKGDVLSFLGEKQNEKIIEDSRAVLETECGRFKRCHEKIINMQASFSGENYRAEIAEMWNNYNKSGEEYLKAHKYNPVVSEEYNKLREELFIRAWKIHQLTAFASGKLREVFSDALTMISEGEEYACTEESKEEMRLLYNSLFFVSPVISSTFASVGRFFQNLSWSSSLGVLIVDEAGQVSPQDAMGALFRVKKVLAVGDPKQIPPVLTDAQKFALSFAGLYTDASETPSLQQSADAVNRYGTVIDGSWAGCPLIIHRRCNYPMFDIFNELSYDNTMINVSEEPSAKKKAEFILDDSYWIQVRGKGGGKENNYFIRRQAEVVFKMILEKCSKLKQAGDMDYLKKGPDLFVISPFKSVAEGFRNYIRFYLDERKKNHGKDVSQDTINALDSWLKQNRIGTVHTFQGKEADEVILLLGCDKNSKRSMYAAQWIFKNIVNVAASRAKYRLYFVGDMDIWRHDRSLTKREKEEKESPVNTARILLNKAAGKERKLGIKEINRLLTHSFKVGTGKEEIEYFCPVCQGTVKNGSKGWFCRQQGCKMRFRIYDDYQAVEKLNASVMSRLMKGESARFYSLNSRNKSKNIYDLTPEIVEKKITNPKTGMGEIIKCFKYEKAGCTDNPENRPEAPYLICNCSKLVQALRVKKNDSVIPDYFDFMILDAIYTIKQEGKNKFTSFTVLRHLSGKDVPNGRTAAAGIIDERLQKLMNNPLFKPGRNKRGPDKNSKVVLGGIERKNKYYYFDSKPGMTIFFDFLDDNGKSQKDNADTKLYISEKYLNLGDFPITVKWLIIKYYILYRIAYIYRVKMTSNRISFSILSEILKASGVEEKEKTKDGYRMENKRFRKKIIQFLDLLHEKKYIMYADESKKGYAGDEEENHNKGIETSETGEGYCGIKAIVINPRENSG